MPVKLKVTDLSQALEFLNPRVAKRIIDRFVAHAAEEIWVETARLAPYRTGRFARRIFMLRRGWAHYVIGTPVEYAPFVEFGTRPHLILPRRARALRFVVDHMLVFAKRVEHPGTKPQRVFARSIDVLRDSLVRLKLIQRAVKEVLGMK